jgi:predicted ATPase
MDRVWPGAIVGDNTLQVHISAVRKALGPYRTMLKTVSGRGYRLLDGWTVRHQIAANPPIDPDPDPGHPASGPGPVPPSAQTAASNFPMLVTGLVGRSDAARLLRDLVSAYRVVTLTGPGGIGKTALAVEAARGVLDDFEGGGRFVELAALSDPDLVPAAVAHALGVSLTGQEISARAVAQAVGGRNLLLILDNCEHVIDAVANLAEMLVRQCPETTILVTSREVLRIDGEYVFRVPPLDVPAMEAEDPDHILGHSAVELFFTRMNALDSGLSPRVESLRSVVTICRQLDGIPLAIEFAASRAATLGIERVAAGLHDRFALLTGGRRTALPRHQTLRATLDWSYQLLPASEQLLLRHLAVFAGAFTLEAAVTVMRGADAAMANVVESIANLVARSLVVFDGTAAPNRWRLLETIRAYAQEKLDESGEIDAARRRHAGYFRDLFAPPAAGLRSRLSQHDLTLRVREIDNVRAALDWAFSPDGDPEIGVDLTAAYGPVWLHLSLVSECRERCEHALLGLQNDGDSNERPKMLLHAALGSALLGTMGPAERTKAVLIKALEAAENLGDLDVHARVLLSLSGVLVFRGEYGEATAVVERLQQVARKIGDPSMLVVADRRMGQTLFTIGRIAEAQACFERVLRHPVSPADQRGMVAYQSDDRAMARAMLSRALCLRGFAEQAHSAAQASLDELQGTTHQLSFCRILYFGPARTALIAGDLATAATTIARLSKIAASLNAPFWQLVGRFLEGKLMIARGEFATGTAALREAFETCRRTGWRASYPEFMGALGEGLAGLGRIDDAIDAVDDAVANAGRGAEGQVWYVPELFRIKGELLVRRPADRSTGAAEACFDQAREMAVEQGALLWELRVAISVARLRVTQGRQAEAKQLLVPIYERFTEGFATADLRAARGMLEGLPS